MKHNSGLNGQAGNADSGVLNEKSPSKSEVCLDLSNQSLKTFPLSKLVDSLNLQFLYLQNNVLKELPSDFFNYLPSLRHLDLRQNQLLEVPPSLAGHDSLEVLLLQDNQLTSLPFELGQVPRLRKLQFSGNPLTWPPSQVLSEGLGAILSFLRAAFMEQLSRGDMDVIPKANEYECTKDMKGCSDQLDKNPILKELKTCEQRLNSILLSRESGNLSSSVQSCTDENSVMSLQKNSSKKEEQGLILLKGNSKQQKKCVLVTGNKPLPGGAKSPFFKMNSSSGHALAIINGQCFPLGYKKRCPSSSTNKIYKALLKKLWVNQLKSVLQSQDRALQKLKSSEALRQWRQDGKVLQKITSHHKQSELDFPYDLDSSCMKMVTRADWQLFQNMSLEKRGHSKPNQCSIRAVGLQEKIDQILKSFDDMNSSKIGSLSNNDDADPPTRCKLLSEEMKRINDLQKAVQALRLSML